MSDALSDLERRHADRLAALRQLAGDLSTLRRAVLTGTPGTPGTEDPELSRALDAAWELLVEQRASATALVALCADTVADLEIAVGEDHHRRRRQLSTLLARIETRIERIVRQESDRAELFPKRLDALVAAFAPLGSDSPHGLAAEREVAELSARLSGRR